MNDARTARRAPLAALLAISLFAGLAGISAAAPVSAANAVSAVSATNKTTKSRKPAKPAKPTKAKSAKFNAESPVAASEIAPGVPWLNGAPRTLASLRGKVILLNFWTFGCINCQRTLPHVKDLYAKYHERGFEIVGIHTPEFDYEKDIDNIKKAVKAEGITWPVVQDNDFVTWKKYKNIYWPAFYYVDKTGNIRHFHAGEGKYAEQDAIVAALLAE